MVKGVLWTGLMGKKKKKNFFPPSVFDFKNVNKTELAGVKLSFS